MRNILVKAEQPQPRKHVAPVVTDVTKNQVKKNPAEGAPRPPNKPVKSVIGSWSAYRILAGGASPKLSATIPEPRPGANF